MANGTLNDDVTLNDTFTINKKDNTKITLSTAESYVPKDIEIIVNVTAASPSFTGGALTNKEATVTTNNMTTSSSNTSGISITPKGNAGRAAVTYNNAVNGWVTAASGATASAAISKTSSTQWSGNTIYVTGVILTNGNSFNITVPNGSSDSITFHFTVDSNGNTTVT